LSSNIWIGVNHKIEGTRFDFTDDLVSQILDTMRFDVIEIGVFVQPGDFRCSVDLLIKSQLISDIRITADLFRQVLATTHIDLEIQIAFPNQII
jgi:hypothetical protein